MIAVSKRELMALADTQYDIELSESIQDFADTDTSSAQP